MSPNPPALNWLVFNATWSFPPEVQNLSRAPNLQESSPSTKSAFSGGVTDPLRCPAATTIANQLRAQASASSDPNQAANLVADAGLAGSRSEARRLAQGGGLKVNNKAEPDAGRLVTLADLKDGAIKLAAGKKKIVLVKPA